MIRDKIKDDLIKILKRLGLNEQNVLVTRSSDLKFGDYFTNIAMTSMRGNKRFPMDVAKKIAYSFENKVGKTYLDSCQVAGSGFINFFLKKSFWQEQVGDVLKLGEKYGSNDLGKGKKARVEFVSANPTGPLHFGNARGGPIGDTIARVLAAAGYEVLREYIDNDRGNQVLELGKTLAAKAGLIKVKDDELTYKGEYTQELAEKVKNEIGDISNKNGEEIVQLAGDIGVKALFEEIIADCRAMGIGFDLIVHESELQAKAKVEIAKLEKKGLIRKKDGALWFSPRQRRGLPEAAKNEFLENRDAVVVKSDGNYTYFTADVVYHTQKFESGYDLVIDVFGSNTFGHVPKLKALASVLGFDLKNFIVILYQFVRIKRGNDIVKMSKRAGNFVTVREVLDEVGSDALRFFILMHDANTHMDFDLDLAREKSSKNPVYYVQYAHARISSILSNAKGLKTNAKANYNLLTTDYELALIKQITKFPELVEDIAGNFAAHTLTAYARELADSFHKFYENCKVISEDKDLTAARSNLVRAAQIGLANTLSLLGVSAPEKM